MPSCVVLLPSVRVVVRGWLNCNQIVLRGEPENVVIDSGYGRHAGRTLDLLRGAPALGPLHLDRLINTHCHSDHMGGNALLRRTYRCRITIPAGEVRHVEPWTEQSCWAEMTDQYVERFDFDDTIAHDNSFEGGGLTWHAREAPGHDMDALMFWCEEEGILITGDALWENGLGFVWPESDSGSGSHIAAALETLDRIESLKPRIVIPGHGEPFAGIDAALDRARGRLQAFARHPEKNARHVVKVMFVFALLDRGRMAVADLPGYLESVPVSRDMKERYLSGDFNTLAERTLAQLLKAKAVTVEDGWITPNMAA